jgi:hypothetical protein
VTPTVLAQYLRVCVVYAIAVAATVGAGYELIKSGDFNNPIVVFAAAYDSSILGFHIGITNPSSPTVTPEPVTASVGSGVQAGTPDPNPPIPTA